MKKEIHDLVVIENKPLGGNNFVLLLKAPELLPFMLPGQFCEVRVDNNPSVYLRRPFSIHEVDYDANTITLLIKSVGKGTATLSGLLKGAILNIVSRVNARPYLYRAESGAPNQARSALQRYATAATTASSARCCRGC